MENSSFDIDTVNREENTFKHFYFPLSDEEDTVCIPYNKPTKPKETSQRVSSKRHSSDDGLDLFFEEPKKKTKKISSLVGRARQEGMSYISTNSDDGADATHLIKIEIYDMKKLAKIPTASHWKHANVRVKYYAKGADDIIYGSTKDVIYKITKDIADTKDSRKYTFKSDQ